MNQLTAIASTLAFVTALTAQQQRPSFDAADPWWEHVSPASCPLPALQSPEQAAALPADATGINVVWGRRGCEATLAKALRRQRIDELLLVMGTEKASELPWADVLAHRELRAFGLSGVPLTEPARVRELRQLPALRSLTLSHTSVHLDARMAAALVELRGLRNLDLSYDAIDVDALAALSRLPQLESLALGNADEGTVDLTALFAAAARLPTLRLLRYAGAFEPLPADALRQLRAQEHLVALQLPNFELDDDGLDALPRTLQHLLFSAYSPVTPDGLARLVDMHALRSLSLHGQVPAALRPALGDLLPKLPLESLELLDDRPDEALWRGLEVQPLLRRLRVDLPDDLPDDADAVAALFERCLRLQRLEVLFASVQVLPTPAQLAPLAGHRSLRRIVLRRAAADFAEPTEAELAALRGSVKAAIVLQ